ncbi:uncharacterized protein ACNS7B_006993 [Menidia menidia]
MQKEKWTTNTISSNADSLPPNCAKLFPKMVRVTNREKSEDSMVYANISDATAKNNPVKHDEVYPVAPGRNVYKLVAVSFGFLCILQVALNIYLRLAFLEFFDIKTSNKNLTEERDELKRKLNDFASYHTSVIEERDELKKTKSDIQARLQTQTNEMENMTRTINGIEATNRNLTEERDELKRKLNDLGNPGWTLFRGSAYYVSATIRTWEGSRNYCREKGADLMIINSEEEQNFANLFGTNMWIGLSDSDFEGTWKWVDGTQMTESFWTEKEPNGGTKENCGNIKSFNEKSSWNDEMCSMNHYWICEKLLVSNGCTVTIPVLVNKNELVWGLDPIPAFNWRGYTLDSPPVQGHTKDFHHRKWFSTMVEMSTLCDNVNAASPNNAASKSLSYEERKGNRAAAGAKLYKLVAVTTGLICVLQTALNISLCFALYNKSGNKTLTEETEELKISFEIESSNKNITEEQDELQRKLTDLVSKHSFLTEERNQLKKVCLDTEASNKNLTEERDVLKGKLNDIDKYAQDGWLYFRGSVYYISTIRKTWQDSQLDCWNRGADLVVINSKEEEVFTRKPQKVLWIGLTDKVSEGHWKWVDGTPLTQSYWFFGEPNNFNGRDEDCAEIQQYNIERSWNDVTCTNENFFICEKNFFFNI